MALLHFFFFFYRLRNKVVLQLQTSSRARQPMYKICYRPDRLCRHEKCLACSLDMAVDAIAISTNESWQNA